MKVKSTVVFATVSMIISVVKLKRPDWSHVNVLDQFPGNSVLLLLKNES